MTLERAFELAFAVGVLVAGAAVAAAALERASRRLLVGTAAVCGVGAVAAWVAFALEPSHELALSAGGLVACVIVAMAAVALRAAMAHGRRVDAELRGAEQRLHDVVGDGLEIFSNAPSGAVPQGNAIVERLRALGLAWEPKQAWTPVAEFARAGVDAINFGPGEPRFAHTRDEQVAVSALVRSYEVLESLCG